MIDEKMWSVVVRSAGIAFVAGLSTGLNNDTGYVKIPKFRSRWFFPSLYGFDGCAESGGSLEQALEKLRRKFPEYGSAV